MEITGRKILILGGTGLVGLAISRQILKESPKLLIICSLGTKRDRRAIKKLRKEFPSAKITHLWGDILLSEDFKNKSLESIVSDNTRRRKLFEEIYSPLNDQTIKSSFLYKVIQRYTPEIIVDSVSLASSLAYVDTFKKAKLILRGLESENNQKKIKETIEDYLVSLELPRLLRHVQILYNAIRANNKRDSNVKIYLKIGTTGTGGLGFNIPYTHGEDRPSNTLLIKSAISGAHTMLLYLLSKTPDAPIIKEIKPATSISWGEINFGTISNKDEPIKLQDCPPKLGYKLDDILDLNSPAHKFISLGNKTLKSVYLDSGENGLFSLEEFKTLSTLGQMEFITPEEIASKVISEIKGANTGRDVIAALGAAALQPSYRAGLMRTTAISRMKEIEKSKNVNSVAFEILGPPRLSKLLIEAFLLKRAYINMENVTREKAKNISLNLQNIVSNNKEIRTQIISIGIPILLTDEKTLLAGKEIKVPANDEQPKNITIKNIDKWAHLGWVDLRAKNMNLWRERFSEIIKEIKKEESEIKRDLSSNLDRRFYNPQTWEIDTKIDPSEVVAWIFSREEKGFRVR